MLFLMRNQHFQSTEGREEKWHRFCAPEPLPGTQLTLRAPRGIAYKALTPPITI